MTRLVLHHVPQTRSMRTLWLLHELGVAFDCVTHPFDKSLRSPAFLALSPVGRVPALEIDGTPMFESGAIAEYLCELFPEAGLGRPPGHAERRDWLVWLHFAETLSNLLANLTQHHIMLRDPAMRSPTVMRLEAARAGKCLAAIDAHLADGRDWILPGGFSAADIGLAQAVYLARFFVRTPDLTALAQWEARAAARPSFIASLPAPGSGIYQQDFYPPPEPDV